MDKRSCEFGRLKQNNTVCSTLFSCYKVAIITKISNIKSAHEKNEQKYFYELSHGKAY